MDPMHLASNPRLNTGAHNFFRFILERNDTIDVVVGDASIVNKAPMIIFSF